MVQRGLQSALSRISELATVCVSYTWRNDVIDSSDDRGLT